MKSFLTEYKEVTSCKTNIPWGTQFGKSDLESAGPVVHSDNSL